MPHTPDTSRLARWLISRSLLCRAVAGSVLLAFLVAGTFALMLIAVSDLRRSTNVQARSRHVTSATLRLEQVVNQLEASLRAFVISGNERFLSSWRQARGRLPAATGDLSTSLAGEAEEGRLAGQLSSLVRAYVADYGLPLITISRIDPAAARAPVATREGLFRVNSIRTRLDGLLSEEAALASTETASAKHESSQAVVIGISALSGAAGLLLLYGLFLARGIARPLRNVAVGASRVAGGDLTTRMPERGAAEILALGSAFNAMARSLEQGKRELEAQNEELRESERMKSQLVSIVSHELRNPLTSIVGYTSLLLNREFDAAKARHYLQIIQQQGDRLTSLIDHFLDSESVESGQIEIDLKPFDLKPLIVAEAKLIADKAAKHRVEVSILPDGLPVKGDRERLAQVFANLLANAVKYSPDGGLVEVGAEIEGDAVRVHVRDEGIGVPEEHQPRIFTKFFRGDARESGIAGTGLGLALAREIVEAHGGKINFTSTAGVGSYFWFELPLDAGAAQGRPLARTTSNALTKLRLAFELRDPAFSFLGLPGLLLTPVVRGWKQEVAPEKRDAVRSDQVDRERDRPETRKGGADRETPEDLEGRESLLRVEALVVGEHPGRAAPRDDRDHDVRGHQQRPEDRAHRVLPSRLTPSRLTASTAATVGASAQRETHETVTVPNWSCAVAFSGCSDRERRVRGLDGLPDGIEQLATDGVEVDGGAQARGERGGDCFGVVARAVEAPIDQMLDALAKRVEQRCGYERRGGHRDRRGERQHIGADDDDRDEDAGEEARVRTR